jgi:hypothetical protein
LLTVSDETSSLLLVSSIVIPEAVMLLPYLLLMWVMHSTYR